MSLPTVRAQDIIADDKGGKKKGAFPTLSILPEGSILRRVRLPRYDENFNPTSLLAAEQLTVLDKDRIEGEGVTIELYEPDGSLRARSKMRSAVYNQDKSTLLAREAVYLKGKNFVASGAGLIFHWETRQGFLNGPASTRFTYLKKDTAMNTTLFPSPASSLQTAALLGTWLAVNTSVVATAPSGLTPGELAQLDKLSRPAAGQVSLTRSETGKVIREHEALSAAADKHIAPFLKSIGQGALLVQSDAGAAPAEQPATKPPSDKKPALKPGESSLLVECDGGLYFDNETGILVYMKNIRLTEDRFKLTCSDELKVFLSQEEKPADKEPPTDQPTGQEKPPESSKQEAAATQAGSKKTGEGSDGKKDGQLSSFGNLRQIIATGKVKVVRVDDQGQPFVAMAETASYEASTGEIILRGGRPRLQQHKNQYLQAQEPGQWIKVLKNGKLVTSSGKWKMVAVLKNRPK